MHQHLFAAIVEVLDDAVTPEVAAARDEVYWLLANALIALEARIYAGAGATRSVGPSPSRMPTAPPRRARGP